MDIDQCQYNDSLLGVKSSVERRQVAEGAGSEGPPPAVSWRYSQFVVSVLFQFVV